MSKMTRKQFIDTHGATCDNWNWSWSFVNSQEKIIIFGAWDVNADENGSQILSEDWQTENGRKTAGYRQSREHVRLICEEGYELRTFPIIYSDEKQDENGIGPPVIKEFIPLLSTKILKQVGNSWYAVDADTTPVRGRAPDNNSALNTFILTWNPENWHWPQDKFDLAVQRTLAGQRVADTWSTGIRRRGIQPGDRAVLLRQRSDRGIVASGWFTSEIYEADHWDGSDAKSTFAAVEWDAVVDPGDRLSVETLKARILDVAWDRLQGSGVAMPPSCAKLLEAIWRSHLAGVDFVSPEELPARQPLVEGASTQVLANRYERNRDARQKCIQHFGAICSVCEFDFAKIYGEIGRGFIHVHHLRELASIGASYVVDPIADLRPVCPNCHAMLHSQRPAVSIAALRARMSPNAV